ncbi:hypothetical protein ETB97_003975, partial [Aspergillus alliaceus]
MRPGDRDLSADKSSEPSPTELMQEGKKALVDTRKLSTSELAKRGHPDNSDPANIARRRANPDGTTNLFRLDKFDRSGLGSCTSHSVAVHVA